jgi:hypothetical protein
VIALRQHSSRLLTGRKPPAKTTARRPFVFLLDFLLVVPDIERSLGKKNQKNLGTPASPIDMQSHLSGHRAQLKIRSN